MELVGIAKLAASGGLLAAKRTVEYFELPTRHLLNRTSERMPFQWTINPYRGCEFGCVYCYARYTHEFLELDAVHAFERKILPSGSSPPDWPASCGRSAAKTGSPSEPPPIPISQPRGASR